MSFLFCTIYEYFSPIPSYADFKSERLYASSDTKPSHTRFASYSSDPKAWASFSIQLRDDTEYINGKCHSSGFQVLFLSKIMSKCRPR